MKENKLDKIFKYLPWVWLVISFVLTFSYTYLYMKPYVDSDMASEMVLADLLNSEGDLFTSTNWFYSTEIRIVYLQVIYRLTLLLFPNNWYKARILGNAIWTIILLLSYFMVTGRKGLNLKDKGVWGAICLTCPFGLWYFWYGTFGCQYIPYMVLVLISTGLILRIFNSTNKISTIVYSIILSIISLVSSLSTIKGLMAIYVPLILVLVLLFLYQMHYKKEEYKSFNKKLLVIVIICLISSLIGSYINLNIFPKYYSFNYNHGRVWGSFQLTNLFDNLSDFLSLFGIQNFNFDEATDVFQAITSFPGIFGTFGYLVVVMLIACVILLIKKYKKLDYLNLFVLVLFLSMIFVEDCVFSFTNGEDSGSPAYWLPILPMAFVIMEVAFENLDFTYEISRKLGGLVLALSLTLTSAATINTYKGYAFRTRVELKTVSDYLLEEGYDKVATTFWNANVISEWTNGSIETWNLKDMKNIESWLQAKNHTDGIDEKFIALFSKDEIKEYGLDSLFKKDNIVYEDDNYICLLYSNYNEYIADYDSLIEE